MLLLLAVSRWVAVLGGMVAQRDESLAQTPSGMADGAPQSLD
jgi:hypothetical protein